MKKGMGRLFTLLIQHVSVDDADIGRAQEETGEELENADDLGTVVEKKVSSLIAEVFNGLHVQTLNHSYIGRGMREEICYEMIYQVQETGRKVTVGMAVETELVLKECGKLLGQTIHALDAMTLSMVEELSQQLVGRLDHLLMPEEHKSILIKKGFLSSDQFNK